MLPTKRKEGDKWEKKKRAIKYYAQDGIKKRKREKKWVWNNWGWNEIKKRKMKLRA